MDDLCANFDYHLFAPNLVTSQQVQPKANTLLKRSLVQEANLVWLDEPILQQARDNLGHQITLKSLVLVNEG